MASAKRKRESFAEATYRPSHNKSTDLRTTNRRTSRRIIVSTPTSAVCDGEKGDVNESSHEFDETIANTLRVAAESVTIRVLQETADEQARVIQAMRSTVDAKDLRIQKLYRKIARRDKRVEKLNRRIKRADIEHSRLHWSKPEAMMEGGTKHDGRMKVSMNKPSALVNGLCTKCGESCTRLIKENQQLRDRLHEVDGLCIRLRAECEELEGKIGRLKGNRNQMKVKGNRVR